MTKAKPITLFSWGYDGWGNGTTQLVRAVDAAERTHGFKPPMFVDVRFQRAARAVGFRGDTFERKLGHDRYRWMKSLGNANIGTSRRGIRINCPDAVDQLLDLAIDAAAQRRRVIFFCSCPSYENVPHCHRTDVAKLLIRSSHRRKIPIEIEEWPGGSPLDRPVVRLNVSSARLKAALDGRVNFPLRPSELTPTLFALPWGAVVELVAPSGRQLIAAGPAQYRSRGWQLPMFVAPMPDEERDGLLREVVKQRRDFGIA